MMNRPHMPPMDLTTPDTPMPAPDGLELERVLGRLRSQYPRILGYLTADPEGEVGLCNIPDWAALGEPAGERSLRIYLLGQGGLLALCLQGLDPLPGIEQALNPLLGE